MASQVLHDLATAWTSTDASLRVDVGTAPFPGGDVTVMRLRSAGETPSAAEFTPPAALDLTPFDELRLWMRADRPADGSPGRPFSLALSFVEAGDGPGDEHRWLVPVNHADRWELRRFGVEGDGRAAVQRFRVEVLGTGPVDVRLFQLRAVREAMLRDLELALVTAVTGLALPGATAVPFAVAATPGSRSVVLTGAPGFSRGNRVRLSGSAGPDEDHVVVQVDADPGASRTTLTFADGDELTGTFEAGTSRATVVVAVHLAPVEGTDPTTPRIVVTALDVHEDPERSGAVVQRDSFRRRGSQTVCSARPAARAYLADFDLAVEALLSGEAAALRGQLLHRLSADRPLEVDGAFVPLWLLPPQPFDERRPALPSRIRVRIGARLEVAAREERPLVRTAAIGAAPLDAPGEPEGITVTL